MKRLRVVPALACAAACGVVLTGCASGGETVVVTATAWVDPDSGEVVTTEVGAPAAPQDAAESHNDVDWQSEYASVLDNPSVYDFNGANPAGVEVEFSPEGKYEYALAEVNGGGNPELLLSSWGTDPGQGRYARVLVFSVDGGTLEHSTQALTMGAAGAGGFRAAVEASQLGRGLYQVTGSSGRGEGESRWCDVDGAQLGAVSQPSPARLTGSLPLHLLITWTPVEDRSALDAGQQTLLMPDDEYPSQVDAPDVVVEGNVVKKTGAELRPEGMPNGEDPNSEYILLQLDSPQEFTDYMHAGEVYTRETDAVALGKNEASQLGYTFVDGMEWEALIGQRVRLTIAPGHVHFQTDASMPTGALRVGRFEQVEVL